jgi:SAM-dependent methyltransferase
MIRVVTDYPVALDSNDHIYPRGTKNDNSGNLDFNERVRSLFGNNASVLDLGCSGGAMVHSFVLQGHRAVGIEGSDYSQKHKRAEWEHLDGTHLFTADITKPFVVVDDSRIGEFCASNGALFDVVTMWEVIEHIAEEDLPRLFDNIGRHLKIGGVVIMSVCPNMDRGWGDGDSPIVDYHQCCHDQPWWETKLAALRWFNNQGLVRQFKDCMVRGGDNAPGSFHMVLERG